ncbi:hypothetical protein K6T82_16755 [Flavobacterium sp. 17A]|uniref:Uncharacterized protein n=1 Tax=Flavobacterium potami TaxID=2872310 RepID=A0A9X1HBT9_9FLAO|nr:hypothetical protein [Flavobacterium potami]MBZ4036423.1 hypothetical protein [Flavobacterium potami]
MEFDTIDKTIRVISKGYYIENIKIVEYIPKEGYIELIDSNYIEINKSGKIINDKIELLNSNKNYKITGKPISEILSKRNIAFYIWIVNPKLKKNDTNYGALAEFIIDSTSKKSIVFESNGGCK